MQNVYTLIENQRSVVKTEKCDRSSQGRQPHFVSLGTLAKLYTLLRVSNRSLQQQHIF
ncbi:hypothetical protein H6G80_32490 [Nostoc sp. FACHB-87]|uniref:hypothetical protein n=1 Tax=Nostocaceae TaxID=1162 RepID=UPI001686356B|nr:MULTISPECIES: hypothetical protein [Nostocaceae]MBD2458766.1 hypothetical protein [Nostoc sp. FACHB-87]MBD2479814.1 hypothetical protein [Anabaena sp. FACHB-83]